MEALQTTKLYLEGVAADLSDNATMAITYVIKDITDIASNGSNYSKTLTLPGTITNNQIFNYYFDVASSGLLEVDLNPANPNIYNNFNPKKRIKATVIKDSMILFDGYAQLVDATITNGLISYDIQLSSPLTAFQAILSGNNPLNQQAYRLEDIPDSLTSGFTHSVTNDNIINSWINNDESPASQYFYPLIDYGQHESVNYSAFYLSDFRPCLFAKQYLDLIFQAAGYTYSSTFFTSDYFKRLVCPYKEGNILVDANGVGVTTSLSADTSLQTEAHFLSVDRTSLYIFNDAYIDPESLYNDGALKFVPALSGTYNISVSANYYMVFAPEFTNVPVTTPSLTVYANFEVYSSGGTLLTTTSQNVTIPFEGYGVWTGNWDTRNPRPASTQGDTAVNNISFTNVPIFINQGQYLKVSFTAGNSMPDGEGFYEPNSGNYINGTVTLGILNNSGATAPNLTVSYTNILDFSTLTYQNFCWRDVTQLDFLTSIVRMFNLYCEQDTSNPYQLNFYTRDEYFSDQTVLDWTNKVDNSQTITVTPLPNLQNNTFLYSYRSDSDWWNTYYTSQYGGGNVQYNDNGAFSSGGVSGGGVYGQQLLAINYDFSTTQLDVLSDAVFSPTIPVQAPAGPNMSIVYNAESTCEILTGATDVISVAGYSSWSGVSSSTQPAPSGPGFAKARPGGKIQYWGNIYTILVVSNAYQFIVDRNVTRTPGAVGGGYYAKNDTFNYLTQNTKTIPAIYQSSDNNVTRSPTKANPRILYYAGVFDLPTNATNLYPSGETWQIQPTPIINPSDSFGYTYATGIPIYSFLQYYPVVHHWNDPVSPTFDLLFGAPTALFFNGSYPPNTQNLFTYYWENQLNEIIDNQAKMWTGYINLNSVDINTLDLSNVIQIRGTNYKINQIIDYAADRSTATQVELIRLPYQQYNAPSVIYPPVANAGPNQSLQLCLGTVNLSASGSTESPTAYLWTILSGPSGGSFSNPGLANTAFTFTNAGVYDLQVQVQPGGSTATTTVTVNAPVANAGSDQSTALCNGHVSLSASGSTGCITSYGWSLVSGPSGGSFGSPSSQNTTFTFPNAGGTYVCKVTLQPGSVTDTVNVVAVAPVANAGTDQILLFPTSSTSVSASGSTGCITSYAWSQISGPNTATISSPSSMNTNVSGLITGTYVLQAEVQPGNVTDTMSIIIDSPVTLTVSGGTSLADTITGVSVGGVSSVYTSGTNFPITGGQTGVFNAGANPFGSVSVVVSLSNAVVGEVVNIIDTAGTHQSTTISTAGAQTVPFTCSMLPGSPASVNVQPEPPTVNISNNRPGATISSVTGIAGFTSGSLSTGASISGYHTAFTGTIAVNFSVGPTSASNLYLTGAFTQTIPVAAGFTGTKTFTSQTYGTTSVIDITLAT